MGDKRQILDDARKFSAQFGGFLKAAELLADVDSVENAAAAAQAKLDGLRQQIADAETKHAAQLAAHASEIEQRTIAQKADVDAYAQRKEDELGRIEGDARAEAERIRSAAQQEAAKIRADAQAEAAQRQAKAKDLADQVNNLTVEHARKSVALSELSSQLDAKAAELERVKQEHHSFLARIGAAG